MRLLIFISFFIFYSCSLVTTSRSPNSIEKENLKIGVIGDLEGNLEQLHDFIDQGDTLYFEGDRINLRDDAHFVFLGDATDRGPGAIRILDILNDLKKRYPDRVTLIAGNREINKLRILTFIEEARYKPVPSIVIPWYKQIVKEELGHNIDHLTDKEFQKFVFPFDNDTYRLKAFLAGMNAKDAFKYRREELEKLAPKLKLSDDDIFNSFVDDFAERGRMRLFLENSELGLIQDGNLFVHGAVTAENFGYVPDKKNRIFNTQDWIANLNRWYKEEITAWFQDDIHRTKLFNYHAPLAGKTSNPKSVIYGRFSTKSGNPKAPGNGLLRKLKANGINRIIVGHTPTGDYPILLRKDEFEIVLADSSYSTLKSAPKIIIDAEKISIESIMPDGKTLRIESSPFDKGNPIGTLTPNGARVIGKIDNSEKLLVMKVNQEGKSFITHYERILPDQLVKKVGILKRSCFQLLSIFYKDI